ERETMYSVEHSIFFERRLLHLCPLQLQTRHPVCVRPETDSRQIVSLFSSGRREIGSRRNPVGELQFEARSKPAFRRLRNVQVFSTNRRENTSYTYFRSSALFI